MNDNTHSIQELKDEAESGCLCQEATLMTSDFESSVYYAFDTHDNTVKLTIEGMWFAVQDLKELRKFLKIAIAELKSQE